MAASVAQSTKVVDRPSFVCYTKGMKSGTFLHVVSTLTGIERKSLVVFDRALKEAQEISTAVRGSPAPDMTKRDLATTLCALLATDKPARAVELFRYFAGMQLPEDDENHGAVARFLPDPNHTFLDFMTAICDPEMVLKHQNEFTITAVGTIWVEIRSADWKFYYRSRAEFENISRKDSMLVNPGIQTSREITSTRLQMIKVLISAES